MKTVILIIIFIMLKYSIKTVADTSNPDKNLEKLIRDFGYPIEIHKVTTKDGYILELHRIPGGKNSEEYKKKIFMKPVVLMMHGILCSSANWVVTLNRSLAFMLADAGYDVWMGNNRGNTYSKGHISQSSTSFGYWDFSWHELGIYDVPSTIDYILKYTEKKDLTYVCFSQGCTQIFVAGSLMPEYNKKIKFIICLAPVVFAKHLKAVFVNLRPIINFLVEILDGIGYFEFLPASSLLRLVTSNFCKEGMWSQKICLDVLFSLLGQGYDDLDRSLVADTFAHIPAGCSIKQLIHYWHSYLNHGTFSQYDYGPSKNLQIYNSTTPPEYPLENVKVPIAIFHGLNDYLATKEDVTILAKRLSNVVEKHLVTSKRYNHMDFLYGFSVKKLVYDRVLYLIEKYKNNRNY